MAEPTNLPDPHANVMPAFRPDPRHRVWPNETRTHAQSLFREMPLFRDVPPHHLRQLARLAHRHEFEAGEVIIRMGDFGSTLYVIKSGRVEVVLERPTENIVVASLGQGEVFGELAIFDGELRSATVIAVEPTETVTLDHIDIVRVIHRSPELALSLLKSLSGRLRAANARASEAPSPS